jgi:polysaccharide pyruvyl transferase WcaK-like protein
MLIEIKGIQFENKGAELMLHSILWVIKKRNSSIEICLNTNKKSPFIKRAYLGAYQKVNLVKNVVDLNILTYFLSKNTRKYLKMTYGIVFEADVDVVLDASGFLYGDQWPQIIQKQNAKLVDRFFKKGKKYIYLPQAFGPFKKNRGLAKKLLEHASRIFPRDNQSYRYVTEILDNTNIISKASDFTNLIEPLYKEEYEFLKGAIGIIPNSKMISVVNDNKQWDKVYVQLLIRVINILKNMGKTVYLLNHEGEDDKSICSNIKKHLEFDIPYIEEENPIYVKGIIANSSGMICSRYHGCISALSQGVPCLATSWSHKYEELFEDYGLDERFLFVSSDTDLSIKERIMLLFQQGELLKKYAKSHKQSSLKMWNEVFECIGL